MIANRQIRTIKGRGSYSSQNTQPPCRNSIEWRNRKQALNNSAQQILSRQGISQDICLLDDDSDIENVNNINLTQNSNRILNTQMDDNTVSGSVKGLYQKTHSFCEEGKGGEISFSKNEDLSENPSISKEITPIHNVVSSNQFRQIKKSNREDEIKIDLYQNVQNSYNFEYLNKTNQSFENHDKILHENNKMKLSNNYELLSDLKSDEDILLSNNTSAALITNNIYQNQQNNHKTNNIYNSNQQTNQIDSYNNQIINNLFQNTNLNYQNPAPQIRKSTQSLHNQSQSFNNQSQQFNNQSQSFYNQSQAFNNQSLNSHNQSQTLNQIQQHKQEINQIAQKKLLNNTDDKINISVQQSYNHLNDEFFKKKPETPSINQNQYRQKDDKQNQSLLDQQQLNQNISQSNKINQTENNINSAINQPQNTYPSSLVNYNAITTDEQFDQNEDGSVLPSTYRKILTQNGIKYNAIEYERLIKQIPNESELSRLKYCFLPLKIQEQEKIIEKSNQNIIQLQESIQILLKREHQSKIEYQDYQNQIQRENTSLYEKQKLLTKDVMEKDNIIQSLKIQLDKKNNENQELHLKLQKQRQEFSNFQQTKGEIEFSIKEKDMKIDIIVKENEEFKKENKILREEKLQFLDQITNLERNIQVKDNKATKLIIDRKNQNEDYTVRQNILIQENQSLREENNSVSAQNRKLMKNLQDYKTELANLKQTVFELASNMTCFKSIKMEPNQENTSEDQIPINIINQYVELLKQQLQHLKNVEDIQNKKNQQQVRHQCSDGIPTIKEQNKFEGNASTFRRQELD